MENLKACVVSLMEKGCASSKAVPTARKVAALMKENGRDAVLAVVFQCVDHTLVQYKAGDRDVARFFKLLAAMGAVPQADLFFEGDAAMAEEVDFSVLRALLAHILPYARCDDKTVRHGVCALWAALLADSPAGFELSDATYDAALKCFVALASDGTTSIRTLAIVALKPLQDIDNEHCKATATIASAVVHDASPVVRLEALRALSSGVGIVIGRVQDTNPKVRKEALKILGDVAPSQLSPRERLLIVHIGRNDPSADVRDAFTAMLCTEWLAKHHDGDLIATVATLASAAEGGSSDASAGSDGVDVASAALEHIFECCDAEGGSGGARRLGAAVRASLAAAMPPLPTLISLAEAGTLTHTMVFIWCARLEYLSAKCDAAREEIRNDTRYVSALELDGLDEARIALLPTLIEWFDLVQLAEGGGSDDAGAAREPSALGSQLLILGKQLVFDDATLEAKVRTALESRLCHDSGMSDTPSHVELLLDVFVRTHNDAAACTCDLIRLARSLADEALAAAAAAAAAADDFDARSAQRVTRALQIAHFCLANCGHAAMGGGATSAAAAEALTQLPATLFMPALELSTAVGCGAEQTIALRRWALSALGVHCCATSGQRSEQSDAVVAAATEQLLAAARNGETEEPTVRLWATKALMDVILFFPDCLDEGKAAVLSELMGSGDEDVASAATEGACKLLLLNRLGAAATALEPALLADLIVMHVGGTEKQHAAFQCVAPFFECYPAIAGPSHLALVAERAAVLAVRKVGLEPTAQKGVLGKLKLAAITAFVQNEFLGASISRESVLTDGDEARAAAVSLDVATALAAEATVWPQSTRHRQLIDSISKMSAEAEAWARLEGARPDVLGALASLVEVLHVECKAVKRSYAGTTKTLVKLGEKLAAQVEALSEEGKVEAAGGSTHATMLTLRSKTEVAALFAAEDAEEDGEEENATTSANVVVARRAPRAKRRAATKASEQMSAMAVGVEEE